MANETLETRTLRQAKNVNLGAFMAPSGSVGNATPDYVSNYNPWEGVGEGLGRGIKGVADTFKAQQDQAAKEAENKAESDMYLEVYNIQRTPSNMMTASQKEIEIDKVVNKYSGIVSVPKIHAVLNANGAQPEKTYTRMSEQKGKEQLVAMQETQNEEMAKLAISMDPSFASQTPAAQIEAGKQISSVQARLTAAFDHAITLGDSLDEQTLASRSGLLDETAMYAAQLFPRDARVALYSGKWTPNDTEAFVNSLSMSLSQKVNPVTGTVLSKQQADFYARSVADRLLAQSDKERQEALKKTVEYQNSWMDFKRNQIGTTGSAEDQAIYIMYGKDPATLEKAYGSLNARKTLREDLELIGATANGHTLIPGGVSNMSVSLMAQNNNMPLQQSDARAVLTGRQASQPQSIASNQNLLEQIDSYQDNWLLTLPSDYADQNIDALKQAIPADIQTNIQSLVQANLAPQEGEGWLQRAFRAINNVAVGTGTTQDVDDPMQVRGANAKAINSMLNDYANKLRRIGMSEKDVKDIVSQGITMAGVPDAKGSIQSMINSTANMAANGMLKGTPLEGTVVESVLARGLRAGMESNQKEEPTANANTAIESIGEQPKTIETDNGKVNMTSIYDTKQYKDLRKFLTGEVKAQRMTAEQATNEMSQFLSKVGSTIADTFNSIVGVKSAEAAVLPVEKLTENNTPIETVNDFEIVSMGKSAKKNNNIFNTRGKNKSTGFASFKTPQAAIKEAIYDATTKVERFKGDVMKLCEQYAPRSDNNLTSRYCAGLLYRTPGVSDADKQTLEAVAKQIREEKNPKKQMHLDKQNEGIIRHIAAKYTDLFYKNGRVVTVKPIVVWQAMMETGTELK